MEITNFRTCNHNTIKANFSIYLPKWQLTLHKFKLIDSNGKRFVAPPQEPYEKDGEQKYAPYFFFDKDAHKRFYDKALELAKVELEKQEQPAPQDDYQPQDQDLPF